MLKFLSGASAFALVSLFGLATAQAETRTITFLFTDDDQAYVQRMTELSNEFAAANPSESINLVSSVYDAVTHPLPLQLSFDECTDFTKHAN